MCLASTLPVLIVTHWPFDTLTMLFLWSGDTDGDPFWDGIRDAILGQPSNETTACHHPKPILFSTGEVQGQLKL